MKVVIKRLPKYTVEFEIVVSWQKVKDVYEDVLSKAAKEVEVKGFRKGKAPQKLVENKLDKKKLYEEVIKEIVPRLYSDALKKHNVSPITTPEIELVKAKEGEDWTIKITVAEQPKIDISNYKKIIAGVKSDKKIWLPGQKEEKKEQKKEEMITKIFQALVKEIDVQIPDLLIEREVNKMLSRLLDDVKKLGLTLDQYLQSNGKSADELRKEYKKQAEDLLKLEFILEKISEKEKITVSDKDIKTAIEKVKDEKERKLLKEKSYYLASVLRRQKTLDSLMKPIV